MQRYSHFDLHEWKWVVGLKVALQMGLQLHIVGTFKIEYSYCDRTLVGLILFSQKQTHWCDASVIIFISILCYVGIFIY